MYRITVMQIKWTEKKNTNFFCRCLANTIDINYFLKNFNFKALQETFAQFRSAYKERVFLVPNIFFSGTSDMLN